MTQKPRSKDRRGRPVKSAKSTEDADTATFTGEVKKTDSLTFRIRPQLRTKLEKAAAVANRSVSAQVEYMLGRAVEWEEAFGDIETFKADIAKMKKRLEEGERQRTRMVLEEAVRTEVQIAVRDEMQDVVMEILQKAGLLLPKKPDDAAA